MKKHGIDEALGRCGLRRTPQQPRLDGQETTWDISQIEGQPAALVDNPVSFLSEDVREHGWFTKGSAGSKMNGSEGALTGGADS